VPPSYVCTRDAGGGLGQKWGNRSAIPCHSMLNAGRTLAAKYALKPAIYGA